MMSDDELIQPDEPRRPRKQRPRNDDEDRPRRPKSNGGGGAMKTVLLILGGLMLAGCCVCGSGGGIIVYLIKQEADTGRDLSNDLKQIGIAMHNYHDTYGRLPAYALKTRDGKPGLSWRVELLPYLEQASLYNQFKRDEPWDSPANKPLLDKMPDVFRSKRHADPTVTSYRVFSGKGTVFEPSNEFRGIPIAAINDGLSNTIFVVDAEDAVPWTKPDELPYEQNRPLARLHYRNGSTMALLGDGSIRILRASINERTLRLMIERADGQVIPFE